MGTTATEGTHGRRLLLCHPAEPARLRLLRSQVGRWAKRLAVPEDTVIDLQLVVGEAASNGVEHAYRDGSPGTIEVELQLRRSADPPVVAVRVVDHGRWRPIPLHKRGRGRGLAIIAQLTRDLNIARTDRGTQLTCAVPIRG